MKTFASLRFLRRQLLGWHDRLCRLMVVPGFFLACGAHGQPATNARPDFVVPDGIVNVMLETNGILYVGGAFEHLVPNVGRGGAFNIFSGESDPLWPKANGTVAAIIPDGQGGFYVGGQFTSIGGATRTNLARVRSDRTIDPLWNPSPSGTDSGIATLALFNNGLYIGGRFERVAGQARANVAALNPATGQLLPWNVSANDVVSVLVADAGAIVLGGNFTQVNNQPRLGLAAVNAASGSLFPWNPSPTANFGTAAGQVNAILLSGDRVFVGGRFDSIGGQAQQNLALLSRNTGLAQPWIGNCDGVVYALALFCEVLYVGGKFETLGGVARHNAGAVLAAGGFTYFWNPDPRGGLLDGVQRIVITGRSVLVGGLFSMIGGEVRSSLAEVDPIFGFATSWQPRADFSIAGLALVGDTVVAGGELGPGAVRRQNLAAIDTFTGQPLDWNPIVEGAVFALAIEGTTLYLGGAFTNVGGAPRTQLAAVDRGTGAVQPWAPFLFEGARVNAIIVSDGVAFFGGSFFTAENPFFPNPFIQNLAVANATTGAVLPWYPQPDGEVYALALGGNALYVGGVFSTIGLFPTFRFFAGAVDASGFATDWNPNPNDAVNALLVRGSTVFMGGSFSSLGFLPRSRLAAVDATFGIANGWDPGVTSSDLSSLPYVFALAAAGNTIYAGGFFNRVGTATRQSIAGIDATSGLPTSWAPKVNGFVTKLQAVGETVFAGGIFTQVNDRNQFFLAAFPAGGAPFITQQPRPVRVAVGQNTSLSVNVSGNPPLTFQWQRNGVNIPGATAATLPLNNARLTDAGAYRVIITNARGATSEDAFVTVLQPVSITGQPVSRSVNPGATVVVRVDAVGGPPPAYQWRLNGVNIPGAIDSTLTISNAQPTNAGNYSVIVANLSGTVNSGVASLVVTTPAGNFADNFAGAATVTTSAGVVSGNTTTATSEAGEPQHGGKPGGKSIWLRFRAPATGILRMNTRGSSFDTLLAAYRGGSVNALTPVVADDDTAGFLNSAIAFKVVAGQEYPIAVDGFGGAAGRVVLSWQLDTTAADVPVILTHPLSRTVRVGASVTFNVAFESTTPVTFQWFINCLAIPGATNDSYAIASVGPEHVGPYQVVIENTFEQFTVSFPGFLEIGPDNEFVSRDKLLDLFDDAGNAAALFLGEPGRRKTFTSVAAGVVGTQLLNNFGATTEPNEPNHANVIGGASRWVGLQPAADGLLEVNTEGSEIDTVLAIYTGTSLLNLQLVAQDNNSGSNGFTSRVRFQATGGTRYLVAADGVNGVQGNIQVNWLITGGTGGTSPTTAQPQPLTVGTGASASFSVTVTGSAPIGYFWRFNGVPIAGANNPTHTIAGAQPANAGNYSVLVSNAFGSVTSAAVPLTVTDVPPPTPPVITTQPQTQTVLVGSDVQFSAAADGTVPLRFQWFYNGRIIKKATNAVLTLPAVTVPRSGAYHVRITNVFGVTLSATGRLTVLIPVKIVIQPADRSVRAGRNYKFKVRARGTQPLTYQWRFNGADIPGANTSTYTVTNAQPDRAGIYSVLVSNPAGPLASRDAVLTLLAPKAAALDEGAGSSPVGLKLLPEPGGAMRLEATDNFVRWKTLTNVTDMLTPVGFTDTGARRTETWKTRAPVLLNLDETLTRE